jgi:hypothetical protein
MDLFCGHEALSYERDAVPSVVLGDVQQDHRVTWEARINEEVARPELLVVGNQGGVAR